MLASMGNSQLLACKCVRACKYVCSESVAKQFNSLCARTHTFTYTHTHLTIECANTMTYTKTEFTQNKLIRMIFTAKPIRKIIYCLEYIGMDSPFGPFSHCEVQWFGVSSVAECLIALLRSCGPAYLLLCTTNRKVNLSIGNMCGFHILRVSPWRS